MHSVHHRWVILVLCGLLGITPSLRAQVATNLPADSPRSFVGPIDWWRTARFGMFVHFGPVSLKGTEIGWSRAGDRRDRGDKGSEVPAQEYDALYKQFNPTNFNAVQWTEIARDAGMKYVVFTAKHHDGFCEFDSVFTDYKITRSPFQRDICAELSRACQKTGLRLGFYYSPPDWHDENFFTANHARYVEYLHRQVCELLTHYAPVDVLWFDTDGGTNTPETWDAERLITMVRQLQPGILLTKRCAGIGDFDTPEQRIGGFQTEPWESCMTICQQWAWKPNDTLKSLRECVRTLVSCAGGDGNLLLNVGPMPDGRIEPRQAERLHEIGQWLARNGESIYGTRGGPWKPAPELASTRRDNTVFLHVLKPSEPVLHLPDLPAKVRAATTFEGASAPFIQKNGELTVNLPTVDPASIDLIVRLELDRPAMSLPILAIPANSGFNRPDTRVAQGRP